MKGKVGRRGRKEASYFVSRDRDKFPRPPPPKGLLCTQCRGRSRVALSLLDKKDCETFHHSRMIIRSRFPIGASFLGHDGKRQLERWQTDALIYGPTPTRLGTAKLPPRRQQQPRGVLAAGVRRLDAHAVATHARV